MHAEWEERKRLLLAIAHPNSGAQEVRDALQHLKDIAHDDEVAHAFEDNVRHAVLERIARGATEYKDMAAVALDTSCVEFSRWCS